MFTFTSINKCLWNFDIHSTHLYGFIFIKLPFLKKQRNILLDRYTYLLLTSKIVMYKKKKKQITLLYLAYLFYMFWHNVVRRLHYIKYNNARANGTSRHFTSTMCLSFYFFKLYKIRIHILCRHSILTKLIVYKLQNSYFAVVHAKQKFFPLLLLTLFATSKRKTSLFYYQINSVNGNDKF